MIPTWPQKARSAIAYLYRPLQDVDIFVEDAHDEVFYTELFRRIAPKNVRIAKVVSLGNRFAVIEKAKQHDFSARRALFVVDGDLEWVRGEPSPQRVYRLDAYCIENLLLHEDAALQVVMEESVVAKEEAQTLLNFTSWLNGVCELLLDLFVAFAVLNYVAPSEPTVGLGVGQLLTASKKGVGPRLDPSKVRAVTEYIKNKTVEAVGIATSAQLHTDLDARVARLSERADIISGKDYLLPLFQLHFSACAKSRLNRTSIRMRLARHCSLDRLKPLSKALADS